MKTLICKKCGSTLTVSEERDIWYCEYCGAQIIVDDEYSTHRYVDEARIKEAEYMREIRLREIALAERRQAQEEQERERELRRKRRIKNGIFWFFFVYFSLYVLGMLLEAETRIFSLIFLSVLLLALAIVLYKRRD